MKPEFSTVLSSSTSFNFIYSFLTHSSSSTTISLFRTVSTCAVKASSWSKRLLSMDQDSGSVTQINQAFPDRVFWHHVDYNIQLILRFPNQFSTIWLKNLKLFSTKWQIIVMNNYTWLGKITVPNHSMNFYVCQGKKAGWMMASLLSSGLIDVWGHWKSDGLPYKKCLATLQSAHGKYFNSSREPSPKTDLCMNLKHAKKSKLFSTSKSKWWRWNSCMFGLTQF